MVFADMHLTTNDTSNYIQNCIKTLVDRESPDLILLTGDNVADETIDNDTAFRALLESAMNYVESKKIPWMHVYGNHDSEGNYTREQQQAVYESFEYCISKSGDDLTGVGNYVIPIYSSTDNTVKFAVWGLDSGSYMSNNDKELLCPAVSSFNGYPGTAYDYIHGDQIEWYENASKLLEDYNGNVIPGLMAFHIPLQETYTAWLNRDNLGYFGEKQDAICSSAYNSGLFASIFNRGDIKAIVNGHDHTNDFAIDYGGVKLCYSPNFSFNTYTNENMHGSRVFIIREDSPSNVETYVSYINERPNGSNVEKLNDDYLYDFESELPIIKLTGFAGSTESDCYINEIIAEIIPETGINNSNALAIKRTQFHDSPNGKNIEARWNLEAPGKLGENNYLTVWIDLESNAIDFRKACFGLIANNANAVPYSTDNYDSPCTFYFKADGTDTWQEFQTGADGCIGKNDGCSVDSFKGYFAFPIEYIVKKNGTKLDENSIITGIYLYLSFETEAETNKYVYMDNVTLSKDLS